MNKFFIESAIFLLYISVYMLVVSLGLIAALTLKVDTFFTMLIGYIAFSIAFGVSEKVEEWARKYIFNIVKTKE